jgi:hypothetical protein
MTKTGAVLLTAALVLAIMALAVVAAACGGDSDGGLSVLNGASPSASPSAGSTTPSASPTPTESATPTETPTDDSGDTGDTGTAEGDVTADEFATYLDEVRPWYDEITAVEARMINVIALVEENQISPGQGATRLERLGWKLDPPVTELAAMSVPPALDEAHTAWLDGISFEARAFARLVELMGSGTYQRGSVDPEYDQLFQQASDKWDEWRQAVQSYESSTGVEAPWMWYGE